MDMFKNVTDQLGQLGGQLQAGLEVVKYGLILLAAFAALYALRTLGSLAAPLATAVRWLFGVRPGEEPSDVVKGIVVGLRMSAWAGLLGMGLYCLIAR
jgi:hypothetical protein